MQQKDGSLMIPPSLPGCLTVRSVLGLLSFSIGTYWSIHALNLPPLFQEFPNCKSAGLNGGTS